MYQALYRKYRPQTFDEVVGQLGVTQTLKTQLRTGRLSHAYLFTGSRGTGKTSCAKILAKAVNCLNPQDGNPCNTCAACRSIDAGSCMDVLEIDAASNNGVDNVRDLRDDAIYTPSEVQRRVYIIDEVHMLSISAFNALLKIIEEPPEHLIFILATTELHKVPATILSRCQRFSFRRISPEDVATRLQYVDMQTWMLYDILQKADRMSMANSLELRVPFLDRKMLELAATLPTRYRVDGNVTKVALRGAALRQLPERTANKKKLGFPVPLNDWLRQDTYYNMVRTAFTGDIAARFFDRRAILKLLDDHREGAAHNMKKIWSIYTFILWYEQFFVLN